MALKYQTNCNFKLSLEDRKRLQEASDAADVSLSLLVRKILQHWLNAKEGSQLQSESNENFDFIDQKPRRQSC